MTPEIMEGHEVRHEALSVMCRELAADLSVADPADEVYEASVETLKSLALERSYLEDVRKGFQDPADTVVCVRAMQKEVPLDDRQEAEDVFLQTRTVGIEEARRELVMWYDPALDEVVSLESTTQAVERLTTSDVEALVRDGARVLQVPGKAVMTRKSGVGKRRFRAVACGNYMPAESLHTSKEELYASGVEAVTLRTAVAYTAARPNWKICTIDVKPRFSMLPFSIPAQITR